jgi:uncharacterized membrane protein HdeD (DUF308 family)
MTSDEYDSAAAQARLVTSAWQAGLFLGVVTLILGLIVALHPSGSLNVIAVLLGVLMIVSGLFNLIRVFDPRELHRVWLGIAGLLFIVIGVILIRHLNLTRAIIGLVIGRISGGVREGRAWWIFFGVVSLAAGIVVAATPASSVNVLATLLGIWFIIMGICEIIGSFILRHAVHRAGKARAPDTTPV